VFDLIVARPALFPMVYEDVRRALLRRFPYGIFFRDLGGTRRVIAVMDLRRDPQRWRRRA
jgi:hypothetical protein